MIHVRFLIRVIISLHIGMALLGSILVIFAYNRELSRCSQHRLLTIDWKTTT
jgi:hypothetical protein